VEEILVSLGDTVSEGTAIVSLAATGGQSASDAGAGAATTSSATPQAEAPEPSAQLPGSTAPLPQPAAPAPPNGAQAPEHAAPDGDSEQDEPGRDRAAVYAGPAVRRVARERGIDLRTVHGSGRRGRIVLEDLDRPAGASRGSGAAGAGDSLGLAPWPSVDFS